MPPEQHHIRKQSFRIGVDSEAVAMALQARLPHLNRTILFDTIERVLDAHSTPGQHIRIASLSVDLGTIPFTADFADAVRTRLEDALHDALAKAERERGGEPSANRFATSAEAARLGLLEHYLTGGTLPFWVPASDFSLETTLSEASASTPDGLVRLLRRHRLDAIVFHRLITQLSDAALQHLLHLIAPETTGRTLADVADVRGESDLREVDETAHAPSSHVTGDEPRLATWFRVLSEALQDRAVPLPETRPIDSLPDGERVREEVGTADVHRHLMGPSMRRYDQAYSLRYYLRYGVLPWSAALGRSARPGPVPTVRELLDVLPALPLPLLRAIFPVSPAERLAAALRAVQHMSRQAVERLLIALSAGTQAAATGPDGPAAAGPGDGQADSARAIVRLLEGENGASQDVDAAVSRSVAASSEEAIADAPGTEPAMPWDVGWIKSVLIDRARTGGRTASGLPSSVALLETLLERHPADALHFFGVMHSAGVRPSALLPEAASARLLESSVSLLPPDARAGLTLLLQLVSLRPDREWSGDEMGFVTIPVVFDHVGRHVLPSSFLADVVRVLVTAPIPPSTARRLVMEAERLVRAGEHGAKTVTLVREAFTAAGRPWQPDADGAAPHTTEASTDLVPQRDTLRGAALPQSLHPDLVRRSLEHLPTAAARRIAHLLTMGAALPGDRRLETMRAAVARVVLEGVHEPLSAEFLAAVLRAILGTDTPGRHQGARLVMEAERLATRGELAQGDFDAVREAIASVTGVPVQGPLSWAHPIIAALGSPASAEHGDSEAAVPARLLHIFTERLTGDAPATPQIGREPGPAPSAPPDDTAAAHPSAPPTAADRPPNVADQSPSVADQAPSVADGLSDDARRDLVLQLIDTAPDTAREIVQAAIADRAARARWVERLTEPELARITYLIEPRRHRVLVEAAEALFTAWHVVSPAAASAASMRSALWSFVLEFFSTGADADRSVHQLAGGFFAYAGAREFGGSTPSAEAMEFGQRLLDTAVVVAERSRHAPLRAVLADRRAELMERMGASGDVATADQPRDASSGLPTRVRAESAPGVSAAPALDERARPPRGRMAFSMNEDRAGSDPIYIANAGLVIVAGFLPQLFERLDVLDESEPGKRRVRPDALSRVVHMLQYLVDGRTNAPEPVLCLNKLLCGVALAVPLAREIEMTPRERELCDTLLAAIIDNWTMIHGTSVAGLRETFLQREGRLERHSVDWRLHVQRKTVDVLLDHLPWTISVIAHSWMPEPLLVTW